MALLEKPQHALARRRRVVVRDHRLPAEIGERDGATRRERMRRVREQHQLVVADRERGQPLLGRLEGQDPEVEAALQHLEADLARRHAAHVDERLRVRLAEPADERQQQVHARLVRADHHAPAAQVRKLPDRALRLLRQAQQPLRVALQHPPGVGQRAVLERSVEQPLAEIIFQPPDGLAHRRLGPVQLPGRPREAPLGRHGQKHPQFCEIHGAIITIDY